MKVLALLSVVVACASAAPSGYGAAPEVRFSSYEAPAIRTAAYEAPVVKALNYGVMEVRKPVAQITRLNVDNDNYGTYNLHSESSDGTIMVENANLRNLGDAEGPVSVSSGFYSFIGGDGQTYTTNWVADENGFRAFGAHLPTSPPIPVEIQASLIENARSEQFVSPYGAPAIRMESSYAAPAPVVRLDSYAAPAPVVRLGY